MQSRSETTIDTEYTSCSKKYLITIACQQKKEHINTIQLLEVIMYLKHSIESLHIYHYVYENSGKYRQLHWHAIVSVDKPFRFKQYTKFGSKDITGNTYSINWKPIYDIFKAINYLHKDLKHQTQEDIITNNHYSINRFSDKYQF